jgi:hypothetical protein
MEKILPLKKSGSTIIAIDACLAYPVVKSLIFQYAAYIDILAQNSNPPTSLGIR